MARDQVGADVREFQRIVAFGKLGVHELFDFHVRSDQELCCSRFTCGCPNIVHGKGVNGCWSQEASENVPLRKLLFHMP